MLRGVVLHGCREEVEFDVRIQEEGPSEGVTELGKEPLGLWDSEADVRPWGHEVYMQASGSLLVTREGKCQLGADTAGLWFSVGDGCIDAAPGLGSGNGRCSLCPLLPSPPLGSVAE